MNLSTLRPSDELFLANTRRVQQRIDTATRQIASGKRLNLIGDDPDRVGLLLAARSDLARVEQTGRNLSQVKTEVDTAEGVLQTALKAMDRAATLGAQGATSFATTQSRAVLAGEVQSILDQMVGFSRTEVQGRYLFSGDSDQTPPYESTISGYAGSDATRRILHPTGGSFPVARTAQQIWDSAEPEKNVFAALGALRDALLADDDAAIDAALPALRGATDHLNAELAFYGAAQNRVTEASDAANTELTRLRTQISEIEDTDLLEASLNLNAATRDQQAALQARAKAERGSLFDYLG